jgi:hypothetical protein
VAPRLLDSVPGWDGLEAAAVLGDTVFLAVEAKVDGRMAGYLLRGVLDPAAEPLTLTIDTDLIAPVPITTQLPNMSQEALVLTPDRVAVVFEVNGRRVNPGAHVAVFDHDLDYRGNVPMVHLEYRVTDACRGAAPDSTFWVLNYYYPPEGPLLQPPVIPTGPVEQIVQLRFDGERLVRGLCPPLDLRRDPELPARNWEAMVLLPGRGFLLMTDRYPTTLLAFVPFPDEAADQRGDATP